MKWLAKNRERSCFLKAQSVASRKDKLAAQESAFGLDDNSNHQNNQAHWNRCQCSFAWFSFWQQALFLNQTAQSNA